jgi:hypothetical protein
VPWQVLCCLHQDLLSMSVQRHCGKLTSDLRLYSLMSRMARLLCLVEPAERTLLSCAC